LHLAFFEQPEKDGFFSSLLDQQQVLKKLSSPHPAKQDYVQAGEIFSRERIHAFLTSKQSFLNFYSVAIF